MKFFSYTLLLFVGLNSFSQDIFNINSEILITDSLIKAPQDSIPLIEPNYLPAVDALKFLHDAKNVNIINGSIYYREQTTEQDASESTSIKDGNYSTYTISKDGSVESFTKGIFRSYSIDVLNEHDVKSNSVQAPTRYIPEGQEFIVLGSALDKDENAEDSQRVYYLESNPASEFFTAAAIPDFEPSTKLADNLRRVRMYVDFNKEYIRELLMNFHPSFTEAFEYGLEAMSPSVADSDAYLLQEENPLVIKALKFNAEIKIPFSLKVSETKDVRIRIANLENFPPSQNVFINDSQTGKYYSLKRDGYTFNDLEPGIYEDRFFITFQDLTLKDREEFAQKIKIFVDYQKAVLTILNPELLSINEVRLFDLKGSAILDAKNIEVNEKYEFNLGRLNDGIYVASLRLERNQKVNQKLMVKKLR